ncbi:MAG: hypothetical protein JO033_12925 [Acidobacteriaceae bacterium]|nr:hypothetical protein [Acidobacteriaceae bacterium]
MSIWIAKRSGIPHASPYNIADYNTVDPQYGTESDFRDFVSTAHKVGLKAMLDIVYYRTAPDGMMSQHPDWLVHNLLAVVEKRNAYNNPQVRRYLIESLIHWVRDFSVDGFRCTPTHWLTSAPIQWPGEGDRNEKAVTKETLSKYQRLFAIRNEIAALTTGDLIWIKQQRTR